MSDLWQYYRNRDIKRRREMSNSFVTWFEHLVLGALIRLPEIKGLFDLDKDGDVDLDDVLKFFHMVQDFLVNAATAVEGWANLTTGQKIDKVIDAMKKQFPTVKSMVWVILEAIAYLGLFLRGKL